MSQVISVMVALVMIGMFGYILATNTRIWDGFSRQSQASNKLREYAEYAAYDGTACRGQDILSLVSKTQGDPFVLVYKEDGGLIAYSTDGYTEKLVGSELDVSGATNTLPTQEIKDMCTSAGAFPLAGCTVQQLQDFFLNGNGSSPVTSGSYGCYTTHIVYDSEATSTVVGIIATRYIP